MTIHLSGKDNCKGNSNNLSGKNYNGSIHSSGYVVMVKIKKIKDRILQNYLIPLFSNQWNILKENAFLMEEILKKINYYYDIYKVSELLVYIELLKVLKILIENQKLLEEYDGNVSGKRDPNEIISMVFKTSRIRLLPEYEIYDSIIGKPQREFNEKYDINVINQIKNFLTYEDVTYNQIKESILSLRGEGE